VIVVVLFGVLLAFGSRRRAEKSRPEFSAGDDGGCARRREPNATNTPNNTTTITRPP
jgi:hypothetical protein